MVDAGYSTVQPGGSKSVASWFDVSQRGLAMGIRQAGLPLGGLVAAAVMPLLATVFGLRATLLTGGIVAALGAMAFLCFYRQPPTRESTPQANGSGTGEPYMVRVIVSGVCMVSVHSGIGILTVLYLTETTSLEAGSAALVLVAAQGAGAVGRICLAAWSDRSKFGRYSVVMTSMAAVSLGMAALMTPLGQDVTGSFVPVWGLLTAMTILGLLCPRQTPRRPG